MEDIQAPPTPSDAARPSIKRAQRTCVVLFLLSFIGLVSFGQAPLAWTYGDAGLYFRLSFLPTASWLGAIWAITFFLKRWRLFTQTSNTVRLLGLTGGLVLVGNMLYAILLLSLLLLGVLQPRGAVTTGGRLPLAQTGAETWIIDGIEYKINATYYLDFNGEYQYTVEHQYPAAASIHDEAEALKVAFPIMAHACTNKLYDRLLTHANGNKIQPTRIGVALFEQKGVRQRGYRVALTLSEIEHQLKEVNQESDNRDN